MEEKFLVATKSVLFVLLVIIIRDMFFSESLTYKINTYFKITKSLIWDSFRYTG